MSYDPFVQAFAPSGQLCFLLSNMQGVAYCIILSERLREPALESMVSILCVFFPHIIKRTRWRCRRKLCTVFSTFD